MIFLLAIGVYNIQNFEHYKYIYYQLEIKYFVMSLKSKSNHFKCLKKRESLKILIFKLFRFYFLNMIIFE